MVRNNLFAWRPGVRVKMGIMCHYAIVVTSRNEYTVRAHAEALRCCGSELVSNVTATVMNARSSFLVAPDGSKEGWPEFSEGEVQRARFVSWLHRQRFSDGSSPYDWVMIEYGERPHREGAAVIDSAWSVNIGDKYAGPCDLESGTE
jgi:hypothetical protein